MRQIKFRVWDKRLKLMREVTSIDLKYKEVFYLIDYEITYISRYFSEVEIMQSTGLKDKNGVEIYEGDVLGGDTFRGKSTAVVEYKSAMWQANGVSLCSFLSPLYSVEVIGNIYDNPELMEAER